ncbi:hypothetical protein L218DRAFT_1008670 [Marasmius fiardii PR-910]|nr:hypothetical protein L218DRAFT_1008670 [Marasmius fiardii PR-910]
MLRLSLLLPIVSLALIALIDGAVLPPSNNHAKRDLDDSYLALAQAQIYAVELAQNNPVWTQGLNKIFGALQNMVLTSETILSNIPFVGDPQDPRGAEWNRVQNGWTAPIVAASNDAQTIGQLCHQYSNQFSQQDWRYPQDYINLLNQVKSNLTNAQMTSPAAFATFDQTVTDVIQVYDNYFATTEAAINSQIKQLKDTINTYKQNMKIDLINLGGAYSLSGTQVLGNGAAAASVWGDEGLNELMNQGANEAGIPAQQLISDSWDAYDQDSYQVDVYSSSLQTVVQQEIVLVQQQTAMDMYIYVVQQTASVSEAFEQIRQGMLTVINGIINYMEGGQVSDPPVEYFAYHSFSLAGGHNLLESSCDPFIQWGQDTWTWVESHI